MKYEECRTCKNSFTTRKGRVYCKESLADKDDCGEYEMAIKVLEQEPSGDLISRQAVEDALYEYSENNDVNYNLIITEYIDTIPSVNPQESKTGHWIEGEVWEDTDGGWGRWQKCSVCRQSKHHKTNFCPHCGAKMESEGKE